MLPGLMQTAPLQISQILSFASTAHGGRAIVSRAVDEPIWRYDWAGCEARSRQLANMLRSMGVAAGDRVTSLAWNTHRHLELFFAVPGMGAVLHTANPRLSDEQIAYTINHAGSRVLLFEKSFVDLIDRLRPHLTNIEHFVLLTSADNLATTSFEAAGYEALIAVEPATFDWPVFDENSAAFLCYTSGTTGDPKGALYSHRSVVLHAMAGGLNGALGLSAFDVVMPCSSLYHATAWGLPFIAAINGCKLVLPADRMDAAGLDELIRDEGVTCSGGVPTIWTMYLAHLERTGGNTGALRTLTIGGSAVPRAMAESFQQRHGVAVRQLWGMTETSPIGVVATPTPLLAAEGDEAMDEVIWTRQGRMQFGIELRIVDEDGKPLPHDGETSGNLMVRGPWVIARYFRHEEPATDADGWFDTGDIATIDRFGFMRITDRAKDVIKSGGEWISSIDLENIASACPGVRIAAVVGLYHPKWEERPLLLIEPHEGEVVTPEQILAFLEPRILRWWMPDAVVIAPVPLTATGKIDKKLIRDRYRDHLT
ncbi:long-chain-fatty-acid--CoA ligase [Sphingomonas sp. DBB INV C78]|uniref:long-chain fatty acid--CoA ligase n=1 Tax=Sphingomonas sp. DBB INV C78 TaxID=3349434 RepID=UPI0036D422D9